MVQMVMVAYRGISFHLRDILSHSNVKKHTTVKPNVEGILILTNILQRQDYQIIL